MQVATAAADPERAACGEDEVQGLEKKPCSSQDADTCRRQLCLSQYVLASQRVCAVV